MKEKPKFLEVGYLLFDKPFHDYVVKAEIFTPSAAREASGVPPSLGTNPDELNTGHSRTNPPRFPRAVLLCLEQKLKTWTCTRLLRSKEMDPTGPPGH